jgi:hypothetical protein
MHPMGGHNTAAWSANDPARPEVAWSASFGLLLRWPGAEMWHYGPWGPTAQQRERSSHYHRMHLPADAVLLIPDQLSPGMKRRGW